MNSADTDPLNRMVGGTHYLKLKIQPVELWLVNNLGPVEAACVKYLTRWRDKGGIEDLRKVDHFLSILISYAQSTKSPFSAHKEVISANQYCLANGIPKAEEEIIDKLIHWRTNGINMLLEARFEVAVLIAMNIGGEE